MKTVCMFHCMLREISISNVLIMTSTRFFTVFLLDTFLYYKQFSIF